MSRGLLLHLLALVASLLLLEIGLRALTAESEFLDPWADDFWLARLRARCKSGHFLSPRDTEPDSELGWRMKRNFKADGITHNSRGFRASREFSEVPAGDRILLIGDSFAYGHGVSDDETCASRLEQLLDAETVNTGVNGYGVDQAVLMWELEGRRLRPDFVILGYFVDDFFRNGLSVRDYPKPHFVPDSRTSGFLLKGVPAAAPCERVARERTRPRLRSGSALRFLWRRLGYKLGFGGTEMLRQRSALSAFLLTRLRDSVRRSGARLLIVIIPHCRADERRFSSDVVSSILESCRALKIDCLDLTDSMRSPNGHFYGPRCHWNQAGHWFAARRIVEVLPPRTRTPPERQR